MKKKITILLLLSLILSSLSACSKDEFNQKIDDYINEKFASAPEFDPFPLVSVEFEGIAPFAKAVIKGNPQQLSDTFVINYYLDKDTNIKNGDILNLYCQFDERMAEKNNITISKRSETVPVFDLQEEYVSCVGDIDDTFFQSFLELCDNKLRYTFVKESGLFFSELIDNTNTKLVKYNDVKVLEYNYNPTKIYVELKKESDSYVANDLNKVFIIYEVDLKLQDTMDPDPYDIKLFIAEGSTNVVKVNGVVEDLDVERIKRFDAQFTIDKLLEDMVTSVEENYIVQESDII